MVVAASVLRADPASTGWREDFDRMPANAEVRGKPGTPKAEFRIVSDGTNGVLRMTADRASASLMIPTEGVDLRKTPILRWRWRVRTLPAGGDGRDGEKDDQAIGVYLGYGGFLRQNSLAYRWETVTPTNAAGQARYAGGVATVRWRALRNENDGTNAWYVEERDVSRDFQEGFETIPKEVALSVSCNSQYTGTRASAELDWIEFAPAPAATSSPEPPALNPRESNGEPRGEVRDR